SSDLRPVVDLVQTLSDTVPALVTPVGVDDMLTELRTRLEKLYAGSPEQRALQVHLVLDRIPGVQAPVNAIGGP
ncbi:Mammalian cell entry related domain protein, partial [Mycolicibacterium sphagni]|nr:Mammalian cell entry related domain protein [Mycolicibacterium sphagni]